MTIPAFHIIRSRRKSLAIEINTQAELIVRAPLWTSIATIEKFITAKTHWIETKQQLIREKNLQHAAKTDEYLYLGERYKLTAVEKPATAVAIHEQTLQIAKEGLAHSHELLLRWYKSRAQHIFHERVAIYTEKAGIWPSKLRLSTAARRWGSCNSKGLISLNWRLIMAPLAVIDYVIVHELAHIVEMNHSPRFWNLVAKIMPDYKAARLWLKLNGQSLVV
ncbi:hypothetical protein BH10PSE19_BH10PSE19_11610 [soil metagenome]